MRLVSTVRGAGSLGATGLSGESCLLRKKPEAGERIPEERVDAGRKPGTPSGVLLALVGLGLRLRADPMGGGRGRLGSAPQWE